MKQSLGLALVLVAFASSALAAPVIADAEVRAPMNGQDMTAAYLMITNPDPKDDVLLRVTSPVAKTIELHDVKTTDGVKRMFEVKKLAIKSGATAHLMPGGQHVMLFDLKSDLKVGDTVPLTLVFKRAGTVTVSAAVVARPGMTHTH
jgi:hypothetical protein